MTTRKPHWTSILFRTWRLQLWKNLETDMKKRDAKIPLFCFTLPFINNEMLAIFFIIWHFITFYAFYISLSLVFVDFLWHKAFSLSRCLILGVCLTSDTWILQYSGNKTAFIQLFKKLFVSRISKGLSWGSNDLSKN